MHPPAHQVPGRLRLRFAQLKQQIKQLDRLAASLRTVGGVIAVETSPITGGLLIHFDARIGNTPAFWDQVEATLQSYQLLLNPRPPARRDGGPAPRGPACEMPRTTPLGNLQNGPQTRHGHARIQDTQPGRAALAAHPQTTAPVIQARQSSAGVGKLGKSHPASSGWPLPPLRQAPRIAPVQRAMAQPGSVAPWPRPSLRQAGGAEASWLGRKFAGGITSALVDRLIERSAIALVAALL